MSNEEIDTMLNRINELKKAHRNFLVVTEELSYQIQRVEEYLMDERENNFDKKWGKGK